MNNSENGVSLKCTCARCSCYYGDRPAYILRMRRQPCGTAVYIKLVDEGVVYLFDYPAYSVIRPAHQGIRIIEVLL